MSLHSPRRSHHVSMGLIVREDQRILISSRTADRVQAGFWEFPGGKLEAGETPEQALVRELKEEIGIEAQEYTFLISHQHVYPEHDVLLEVFLVTKYTGEPQCLEGQEIAWAKLEEFSQYDFLEANKEIMQKLGSSFLS